MLSIIFAAAQDGNHRLCPARQSITQFDAAAPNCARYPGLALSQHLVVCGLMHTETHCIEIVMSKALAAEAGVDHVQTVTLQALEAVSNRLRDKKLPVRKEAASQLAAVFR